MIRRFAFAAATLSILGVAACATTPAGPVGPAPARFVAEDFAWSARGGQASIQGRVAYRADGRAFSCIASVGLTPDTPYTRARFQTLYGSTERAAVPVAVVRARDIPDPNADYRAFVRSEPCSGNAFSFTGLPDGGWFVIVPVRAEGGEPIVLMQRVQTRGGRIASLTL